MNDERENLSWQGFGAASRELAKVIAADAFEPDLILSIARGGLFLAGSLGYALAVKNLHVMNVEFYDGVGTTLDMPVMLPPVPSAVDFSAKKVLIADDVADSGRTIELVHTFIKDHVEDVRSAVIYEKPRVGDQVRLRLEAHRSLDQLPVELRGARRRTRRPGLRRLTRLPSSAAPERQAFWAEPIRAASRASIATCSDVRDSAPRPPARARAPSGPGRPGRQNPRPPGGCPGGSRRGRAGHQRWATQSKRLPVKLSRKNLTECQFTRAHTSRKTGNHV